MIFKYFKPTRSKKDLAGLTYKCKSLIVYAILIELRLIGKLHFYIGENY